MTEPLYLIQNEFGIVIQRAPYIEDGPYIKSNWDCFDVLDIPSFGGDEIYCGTFSTLKDALKRYNQVLAENT